MELHYRIVNVFAREGRLTGNPLCVFEDGASLDGETMQALARQFNLSETTFILAIEKRRRRAKRAHLHKQPTDAVRGHPHAWHQRTWCARSWAQARRRPRVWNGTIPSPAKGDRMGR